MVTLPADGPPRQRGPLPRADGGRYNHVDLEPPERYEEGLPMNQTSGAGSVERVRISCPGCGRGDWVSWPAADSTYHWKCFNCGKEFDLHRDTSH